MPEKPDAAHRLDQRVAAFFSELPNVRHVLAAVSGGADSLAMLHSLHAVAKDTNLALAVAHLNHGLRDAESDDDAAFVRTEAANLGLPYFEGRADAAVYARAAHLSVEDAARRARHAFFYHALWAWGGGTVALAHTLDDQAETMLLHLLRGSGLDGLRGMSNYTPLPPYDSTVAEAANLKLDFDLPAPVGLKEAYILRPLLSSSRAETEAACAARNLTPRHDSSNDDPHYARNRIRHTVIPALSGFYAGDDPAKDHRRLLDTLARLANVVQGDSEYLDNVAHDTYTYEKKSRVRMLQNGSPSIYRRIVRLMYAEAAGNTADLSIQHVDAVLALMKDTRGTKEVHLPHGIIARRVYGKLIMTRDTQPDVEFGLHTTEMVLNSDDEAIALQQQLRAKREQWPVQAMIDADELSRWVADEAMLELRSPLPGDSLWPLGAKGHKKVQDIFVDAKIPAAVRKRMPVVVAHVRDEWEGEERVVWLGGTGYIDDRLKITADTRRVLVLTLVDRDVEEGGDDDGGDTTVSGDAGGH